jgi:DNA-directed RNA polymerase specialized sigma24 family protein
MQDDSSVSVWIEQLKAGEAEAAQPLWDRYFGRLVGLARKKLQGASRAVADEEDVALSAFTSFCRAVEGGRFPQLNDREDLWRLLVVLTVRKASNQRRDQRRLKRGAGKVLDEAGWAGEGTQPVSSPGQIPGREPTPDFAALVAEECQRLLALLGDELLQAVAISKMEGRTNREMASLHGLALRTVERKLGLIRKIWETERDEPAR